MTDSADQQPELTYEQARAELLLHADNSPLRLAGCGLAIVNPPWKFDAALHDWMPALTTLLAGGDGGFRIDWLKQGT